MYLPTWRFGEYNGLKDIDLKFDPFHLTLNKRARSARIALT